jgi:hypothetical protein
MPLSTKISFSILATLTKVIGPQTLTLTPQLTKALSWASGVALDQADRVYYNRPTIGGSATLSLDLAGALEDVFGDPFVLAKLKLIAIGSELALCPNPINLQRPATNGVPLFLAVSDGIVIAPGGAMVWVAPTLAGVAVTAGTGDLIDIVNTAAGNVQPEILIVGASA